MSFCNCPRIVPGAAGPLGRCGTFPDDRQATARGVTVDARRTLVHWSFGTSPSTCVYPLGFNRAGKPDVWADTPNYLGHDGRGQLVRESSLIRCELDRRRLECPDVSTSIPNSSVEPDEYVRPFTCPTFRTGSPRWTKSLGRSRS